MDLYQEILSHAIYAHGARVELPGLELNAEELVERACYRTLEQIRAVLNDDSLDDPNCFYRIEAIVAAFEAMGSDGGSRHDF